MSVKKILAAATLAGILVSSAACSDITAPSQQKTGWCPVTGSGQTCDGG